MFALGYSACFLSALQLVAREGKVKIPSGVKVKATVKIGACELLKVESQTDGPSGWQAWIRLGRRHRCLRSVGSAAPNDHRRP